MLGTQSPGPVLADQLVRQQGPQVVLLEQGHPVELVGRAEAVEEMDERHPALQGRRLGDESQVVGLLGRRGAEHGEPGAAHRHDVLVIAEDRQALGRQRAGRHVEHRGR